MAVIGNFKFKLSHCRLALVLRLGVRLPVALPVRDSEAGSLSLVLLVRVCPSQAQHATASGSEARRLGQGSESNSEALAHRRH